MPTFKNQIIVLPFDFSNPARKAVQQLLEWADHSNTITILHVVIPSPGLVGIDPPVFVPPDIDEKAQDAALEKMKREYGGKRDNLQFRCLIGDPGSEIVNFTEEQNADLIVMPSHGRTGISRLLLGSVAERVLRLANRPVLVLRGEEYENDAHVEVGHSKLTNKSPK